MVLWYEVRVRILNLIRLLIPVVNSVWCSVCGLHYHQTTAPPRATDHGPCNTQDNRTKGMKTVLFFTVFNPLHSVVVNETHNVYLVQHEPR